MSSPNEGTPAIEWIKIAIIPVSIALGGWLFALISSERALDAGQQALRAEYERAPSKRRGEGGGAARTGVSEGLGRRRSGVRESRGD